MTGDERERDAWAIAATERAEIRGEYRQGQARIEGLISTLASEIRTGNASRDAEHSTFRAMFTDHENRIREQESHRTDDHEARIKALERAMWRFAGAAAVAGAALSLLVQVILALFGDRL